MQNPDFTPFEIIQNISKIWEKILNQVCRSFQGLQLWCFEFSKF
jgi:hypothetical protein